MSTKDPGNAVITSILVSGNVYIREPVQTTKRDLQNSERVRIKCQLTMSLSIILL